MSFFLKKGSNSKRKNASISTKDNRSKKSKLNGKKPEFDEDEEIPSSEADSDFEDDGHRGDDTEEEEEMGETAEEKRMRLAKIYLEEIEKEERERAEDTETLHDAINQRLERDNLENIGKLKREVADQYLPVECDKIRFLRDKNHKLPLTCIVISPDGKTAVTGSKDAGLVKWDISNGQKLFKVPGGRRDAVDKHKGHCSVINALAISSDGKYLASGDDSKLIHIWELNSMNLVKTFKGHRDSVTGLAFRKKTRTLYSASADRAVKIWSLDEMAYVETLFGHQDKISAIDAGLRERAITSGSRDGSVRVWKIVEESQLVFNGPATSIDSVKLINEDHFVTCGEDGHLSLWGMMKKKPTCTVSNAHGKDPKNDEPNWVSAIASYSMTDLIASGSCDGFIRLWKCGENFRQLQEIQKIPMKGFVNSLAFTSDGKHLLAAIGQEHRLGRWQRLKEAKNCLAIVPLNVK